VVISSILFALFHLPVASVLTLFLYFLCGIVLGTLYKIENYLLPCILAHSICNLLLNLS
jgi:membrane protease YdiL (CAAX protease family)